MSLVQPLGFAGAQTIVNDYVRELRPLYAPARTFYRPGEICQFDRCEPSTRIPVGAGQRRRDAAGTRPAWRATPVRIRALSIG